MKSIRFILCYCKGHEEIQHLQDKISQLQKSEGKLEKEVEDLKKQVNATEVVKETALKSSTERGIVVTIALLVADFHR